MNTHYEVADPGSGSGSTDPDPDESKSSDDDIIVEHQNMATAKAFAKKSFFYASTGVKGVEVTHPGLAKCNVCTQKIGKSNARVLYCHNTKRPHAYVHDMCCHRLSEQDAHVAYEALLQAKVGDSPQAAAVRSSIAAATDLLAKKLPQATQIMCEQKKRSWYDIMIMIHVRNILIYDVRNA